MALRFALAAMLLVAVSAQNFASHESINELPKACQQVVSFGTSGSSEWGSSQQRTSGTGAGSDAVCKLLPAVYDKKDQAYDYCLKCKAGEKYGVSAEELAQSIRQQIERKLKPSGQFTRKSKLDIVVDGIKKPIDLTRVLARTPDVLEQVDDLFIFFPNGQIGRIEFEHGQAEQLERITCRAPCRGGPRTGPSSQSGSSSRYPANDDNDNEDEDNEDNIPAAYGSSSSSSRYLSSQQQKLNKQKKQNKSYPYSYGDNSYSSSSVARRNQQQRNLNNEEEDDEYTPYGQTTSPSSYRTNAGRYGDNSYSSSSASARYNSNKQRIAAQQHQEEEDDK